MTSQNRDVESQPTEVTPYSIFSKRQKILIVALVSAAATLSGLSSNIYFPLLPVLTQTFSVTPTLINLTITLYLILQALSPSLWGPISDTKGRRLTYILTLTVYLGSCIGLALAKNFATLMVLRCVQSAGSASTIAVGAGVVGDVSTREERGGYMGWFQAGLLVPVALGPVLGGVLAERLGWRAVFWFLVVYGGGIMVLLVVLLPETLRGLVGDGSVREIGKNNVLVRYPLVFYQRINGVGKKNGDDITKEAEIPPKKHVDLVGPFRILFSKLAAPIIFFLATHYAVWQMSITAMATLFEARYGLNEMQIGLTFIANGVGSIIGTLITGKILDRDYQRMKATHEAAATASNNSFPLEKARLRLVPVFSLLQSGSIILFGWTIHFSDRVHIAVPIITTFITGWTAIATQSVVMTYLVDIFPDRSAAASASLNLARCLLAAGGTSFVIPMVNGVGVGGAFTICAGAQVIALLGIGVQWKNARRWRDEMVSHS